MIVANVMCVTKPMMLRIQGEKAREMETTITPTEMGTVVVCQQKILSRKMKGTE
jgi:hypothetical protein